MFSLMDGLNIRIILKIQKRNTFGRKVSSRRFIRYIITVSLNLRSILLLSSKLLEIIGEVEIQKYKNKIRKESLEVIEVCSVNGLTRGP